jgi:DNA-binding MarR family transcriptional regulator
MEKRGLFQRERSTRDRRQVLVRVTPRGEKLLSRLVRHRIAELRVAAPELARALQAVLAAASRGGQKAPEKRSRNRQQKESTSS